MKRLVMGLACLLLALSVLGTGTPVLEQIPEQVTQEGLGFRSIDVDSLVSDPEHAFNELIWTLVGTEHVSLFLAGRRIFASVLDSEWAGTEVASITVCDPAGACVSQNIAYTVTPVNDPPVLSIDDQIVGATESFESIPIAAMVFDVDHSPADLTWTFESTGEVGIELYEGALTISPPTVDWIGIETAYITVCDPEGGCDSQGIQIARTVPEMLAITRVSVAGYLLCVGEITVAIDALLTYGVSPETIPLLEAAIPPYDPDVILVTHNHSDHFNEHVVAAQMLVNERAVLIGPQAVVESVRATEPSLDTARFVPIILGDGETSDIELTDVSIEAIDYPHSPGRSPRNLGYVVHLGGYAVLHTGDLVLEALDNITEHALSGRAFDVALVPSYIMTDSRWHPFIHSIQATTLIPIHLPEHLLSSTCGAVRAFFDTAGCFLTPGRTLFFDLK